MDGLCLWLSSPEKRNRDTAMLIYLSSNLYKNKNSPVSSRNISVIKSHQKRETMTPNRTNDWRKCRHGMIVSTASDVMFLVYYKKQMNCQEWDSKYWIPWHIPLTPQFPPLPRNPFSNSTKRKRKGCYDDSKIAHFFLKNFILLLVRAI